MRSETDGPVPGPGLFAASRIVARPWTLLIMATLAEHPRRFTDITAALAGISTNLLSERLRALVHAGLVERREGGPLSLYALTPQGRRLRPVLSLLEEWGQELADQDL